MANLSLRGVDAATLSGVKATARRRKISVNRLIVETLRERYAAGDQTYDDIDALAGAWSRSEAAAFETAVAPFAEIDAELWATPAKVPRRKKAAARKTSASARRRSP